MIRQWNQNTNWIKPKPRARCGLMQAEQGARTLTATALVHEAYLRLVDANRVDVRLRALFA